MTLVCERWTLTHSSGWAAVLVGLGLPLALGLPLPLALVLGLAAMEASSEAGTVAEADAWDDDGEAEPGWEGEPVPEGEPDPATEPDTEGEGDTGVLVGELPVLELDAGAVGGAVAGAEGGELEGEEDDGEGAGDDGRCSVGVGVGVGEGVLAAGSAWHLVSVFAPALVEVPGLGEAAPSLSVPARAAPGPGASTPRVRRTPVSRLRTAARTCARRIKDRPTRRGYCVLYVGFGGD